MNESVDLTEAETEMARLDTLYRPIAASPVDLDKLDTLGETVEHELARLNVNDQAEAVLRGIIDLYATGDEPVRTAIRRLFDKYTGFRWAAHLPRDWSTATGFRDHLIHLSARDQGADTRDEILGLQDLCEQARQAGIDIDPILDDVAAMSSTEDRYGMGSMRDVITRYGRRLF